MRPRVLAAVLVVCLWSWSPAGAAPHGAGSADSRYTRLDDCRVVAHGRAGEDWVSHRCKGYGGVPVWITYTDSARAGFGFGPKQNVSGMYGADRDPAWPLEWRGRPAGTSFRPFAMILRVRVPAETTNLLVVYGLKPDGTSCVVGSTYVSNDVARRIADASGHQLICEDASDHRAEGGQEARDRSGVQRASKAH